MEMSSEDTTFLCQICPLFFKKKEMIREESTWGVLLSEIHETNHRILLTWGTPFLIFPLVYPYLRKRAQAHKNFHSERLSDSLPKTEGDSFIFCCDMGDIAFYKPEWMLRILARIKELSNRTFLIQ
jgi:hypothetical protein